MPLSSVLFLVACLGMYKLGAYAERNPGQIWMTCKRTAIRFWDWINPADK